jgi:Xaa-Pro aminopeptidase
MALEDGGGVDFAALRAARRERVADAMAAAGVDVLLLNRPGNTRYVAGHRPIWRAVVTAWGPMCAFVREGRQVHLVATTWDDGVPPEIPHENLQGLSWNPRTMLGGIGAIPGLREAKVVGVDGMSLGMSRALGFMAPGAEIVDGDALLRSVRIRKLPAEVACIRTAIATGEGALLAVADLVRPGVSERELKGAFQAAVASYGVNHPNWEGIFCVEDGEPFRQVSSDRVLATGDLVALAGSASYGAYEGVAARTWPCGAPTPAMVDLYGRWRVAMDAMVSACQVGSPLSGLRDAWLSSGEPAPPMPLAQGVGVGIEAPPEGLDAGMVLVLQGYVWEPGVGGHLGHDVVLVGDDGPERLTRLSGGPLEPALDPSRP